MQPLHNQFPNRRSLQRKLFSILPSNIQAEVDYFLERATDRLARYSLTAAQIAAELWEAQQLTRAHFKLSHWRPSVTALRALIFCIDKEPMVGFELGDMLEVVIPQPPPVALLPPVSRPPFPWTVSGVLVWFMKRFSVTQLTARKSVTM